MSRIIIDGSSTTYGLWGGPDGGWADRVKRAYMPEPDETGRRRLITVHNLAVPRRNIIQIAAEMPAFMDAYRCLKRPQIGVVMAAEIDSRVCGGVTEPEVPLHRYTDRLRYLAETALSRNDKLLFIGPTPVDGEKSRSFGRNGDNFDSSNRAEYQHAMSEVAQDYELPFIDINTPLEHARQSGLTVIDNDGIHPNGLGHAMIFDLVKPVLDQHVQLCLQAAQV